MVAGNGRVASGTDVRAFLFVAGVPTATADQWDFRTTAASDRKGGTNRPRLSGRMRFDQPALSRLSRLKAVTTVNRPALRGLKWNLCLLAAFGASGGMQLSWAACSTAVTAVPTRRSAAAVALGFAGGTALGTPLGIVGEPAFRVPLLIGPRMGKLSLAVNTYNRSVFVH